MRSDAKPRQAMWIVLSVVGLWVMASCGFELGPTTGLECQRMPAGGGELREGEDPMAARSCPRRPEHIGHERGGHR